MNKLNVKDANRLDALRDAFTATWEALDAAVTNHNLAATYADRLLLNPAVVDAMTAYVTSHNNLREFCDDMRTAMGDYFENKSERWQSGTRGQRYHAWMDKFEAVAQSATPSMDNTSEEDLLDMPEDITSDVDELSSEQDDD